MLYSPRVAPRSWGPALTSLVIKRCGSRLLFVCVFLKLACFLYGAVSNATQGNHRAHGPDFTTTQ